MKQKQVFALTQGLQRVGRTLKDIHISVEYKMKRLLGVNLFD